MTAPGSWFEPPGLGECVFYVVFAQVVLLSYFLGWLDRPSTVIPAVVFVLWAVSVLVMWLIWTVQNRRRGAAP